MTPDKPAEAREREAIKIRYDIIYEFAEKHRLSYSELGCMVRASLAATPSAPSRDSTDCGASLATEAAQPPTAKGDRFYRIEAALGQAPDTREADMPQDNDKPARLRIDGAQILRPNGQRFLGRGVSFGSWGENLPGDAEEAAGIGCNIIRDLLRWHGQYGHADIDARDDNAVAFIKRANMQRILQEALEISAAGLWNGLAIDSNCLQAGTQTPEMRAYCDRYSLFGAAGRNAFTDPPLLKLFIIVWQALARAVRPVQRIAWFELLPEPLPGEQYDERWAPRLQEVYRQIIAGVREVDADTSFLIGPRDAYNSDFLEEVYLPERTDVIYTFNILSGKFTNTKKRQKAIRDAADFSERHNVPVWCNQLGRKSSADPDLSFMRATLEEFNEAGIGFAWWQNRQNTSNPGEYALRFKDGHGGWVDKQDEIDLLSSSLKEHA